MPHPLIIGGIILGGTVAAWRLARHERKRLRRIAERIAIQTGMKKKKEADDSPIRLERDPQTGVYRPMERRRQ